MVGNHRSAAWLIEQAIAQRPLDPRLHCNCGEAYRRLGNLDRAGRCVRRALDLDPRNADAWCNHGTVCRELGRVEDAIRSYRRAVELQDDHANAHYNLGLALLTGGNLLEGWREYEYRWNAIPHLTPRDYRQPSWDGRNPAGKTIFVYHEQGQGDTLQFVRYLPRLVDMGANVVFECPTGFHRLFGCLRGVRCRLPGTETGSFDFHIPLLSLPAAFGTTLETIPNLVPYLHPPAETVELWRRRLSGDEGGCRIGICWAGNPQHINDRNRSCRLAVLGPLGAAEGAVFYSLQKGDAAAQSKNPPTGMRIIDVADQLNDWADTAALLETLDLIVTVDTAVAHLAGALGRPVWMLVPFDPDWRWLLSRNDSPWYPTMRLFRQPARRDWAAVSAALSAAVVEARETLRQSLGLSPPVAR
jgi:hypothetical protein